jgi:hypothetical protein
MPMLPSESIYRKLKNAFVYSLTFKKHLNFVNYLPTLTKSLISNFLSSIKISFVDDRQDVALSDLACAKCHGSHRLAYDAKILLNNKKSWDELLKHSFCVLLNL